MNPYFFFALGAFMEKVTCPVCKREQQVSKIRSRRKFPCRFCGHLIEPKVTPQ